MNKSNFLKLNLPLRDNTTDIADINAISDNFEIVDGAFLDLVEKEIPKFQTKENINLNFDDDSNNEEQYPSVPAVVNFTNRKVDPLKIINSASGNTIVLKDSAKDKLNGLKLFGKTTQNGTPTPDNPIELKSVGDSGSFEVGVYKKNLISYPYYETTKTQNGIIWTDNGDGTITANGTATENSAFVLHSYSMFLAKGTYTISGVPVNASYSTHMIQTATGEGYAFNNTIATGETFTLEQDTKTMIVQLVIFAGYTANNLVFKPQIEIGTQATPYEKGNKQTFTNNDTLRGVSGIADEKDFARGVKIQRIKEVLAKDYTLYPADSTDNYFIAYIGGTGFPSHLIGISSHFPLLMGGELGKKQGFLIGDYGSPIHLSVPLTLASDVTTLRQWLIDNNVKFYYPIAEPIEIPISETELNAYRQLYTNKGNTTILSEADMEVDYIADTKLYIDNKIAELTALTLEV